MYREKENKNEKVIAKKGDVLDEIERRVKRRMEEVGRMGNREREGKDG